MRRSLLILLLCLGVAACGPAVGNPGVAAIVNGTEIPLDRVEQAFHERVTSPAHQARIDRVGPAEAEQVAVGRLISHQVRRTLLVQAMEERGLTPPTPEEVQQQLDTFAAQNGGPEAFEQLLTQEDYTLQEAFDEIELGTMVDQLAAALQQEVEITDADRQAIYDEQFAFPEVSHILTDTEEDAQAVVERLRAGEDFAEVAAEVSTDPGSGAQGGALGPLQPGRFIPVFEEAAAGLAFGEVSDPVQSEFGWHVIVTAPPLPLEDVAAEVEQVAEQSLRGSVAEDFFNELFFGADVEVNPRFGTWDPAVQGVADSDPLGDLVPAPDQDASGLSGEALPVPTEGS